MEIRPKPNQKHILRKNGTLDIGSINNQPTMTQQQFKAECDINNIIKQYTATGELPLSGKVGKFLDVSNVTSYQESLQTVIDAQNAFDALPSSVRSRFDNDPTQLIAFIEDDKNTEEAYKLGLLNPKPQTQPQTQITEPQTQPQKPVPS